MNTTLTLVSIGLFLFLWALLGILVFVANLRIVNRQEILKEEIEFLLTENKRTLELIRVENMEKAYLSN
jgi:hypothetical protein